MKEKKRKREQWREKTGARGTMGRGKKREAPFSLFPSQRSPRALIFPSSQPPRVFSQACSQGATVGGIRGGERF